MKRGDFRLAIGLVLGLGGVVAFADEGLARPCLTDAEIEQALGPAVRAGAPTLDTGSLPDLALCSGLTLAQQVQRMRAEAFPEEAARAESERQAAIEQEIRYPRDVPSTGLAPGAPTAAAEGQPEPLRASEPPMALAPVVLRRRPTAKPTAAARRASASAYYPSCRAARAAGVAPIRRGSPGYAGHLDRDGDGIACE